MLAQTPEDHPELERMEARHEKKEHWGLWGTYLSDRQWGTVREDYSADGDAWSYFPFEHSHARAYRWGEDGLLGLTDRDNQLCFAPTFWNGKDPILKERPFGLSNPQGNHGEDLKEYYYFLENTPTYSLMRALYKYPQAAFPYQQLLDENKRRSRNDPEYELVDTGVFNEGRYFDITVDYAKNDVDDICIRISATNRGPDAAPLYILPTIWFRNTWSWGESDLLKPEMHLAPNGEQIVIKPAQLSFSEKDREVIHPWELPPYYFLFEEPQEVLFTENETNNETIFKTKNATPYVKDAFHNYLVHGKKEVVNPQKQGTKAAPLYFKNLAPGEKWDLHLRLISAKKWDAQPTKASELLGSQIEETIQRREEECHQYYDQLHPHIDPDLALIERRAFAGLFWCKKFYYYSVITWLQGDPTMPPPPADRWKGRNHTWQELHAHDLISMPDSWEYPYFCSWDLMFQSLALAVVDPTAAKKQNLLLRGERYTSPGAQAPSYEWSLSDATPPIGAWAAWRIYSIEQAKNGKGDTSYLRKSFNQLLLTYSWWCNRVDSRGDDVFAGGFLGLDNISIFDRRYDLPDGSKIMQSDGTAWMSMFALNMLKIAIELAKTDPEYEHVANKFLSDFVYLASALNNKGPGGFTLWDHEDGFYYDVIKRPDDTSAHLKVRSVVGLTPLFAVESFDAATVNDCKALLQRFDWFRHHRPELMFQLQHIEKVNQGRRLISLVPPDRLQRICKRLFDENEFLSPYGIRSLSKYYLDHPYSFTEGTTSASISYCPAESPSDMFGGNSNWRGPIWIPINFLIIEALQKFAFYYGDTLKLEFPTGSGVMMNLWEISLALERRVVSLFTKDKKGHRPFNGDVALFQNDPHWKDEILFYEYFNGETGAGLGASHQTGWTALVAKLIKQLSTFDQL
jgi:hypothetical protein